MTSVSLGTSGRGGPFSCGPQVNRPLVANIAQLTVRVSLAYPTRLVLRSGWLMAELLDCVGNMMSANKTIHMD